MFVFFILISLIAVGAVVATIVTAHRDGYSRTPEAKFVRSF
ncbi:hypothetical protein [Cryobacterium arcticum]|nr:hypothetical protein [Cryobacterium arcticum]